LLYLLLLLFSQFIKFPLVFRGVDSYIYTHIFFVIVSPLSITAILLIDTQIKWLLLLLFTTIYVITWSKCCGQVSNKFWPCDDVKPVEICFFTTTTTENSWSERLKRLSGSSARRPCASDHAIPWCVLLFTTGNQLIRKLNSQQL
jgi:hypothetical protein